MKTLCFFLFLFPFIANAQVITTYVNNTGIEGYTGDGAPALNAEIAMPLGMNFDDTGNLVVGTAGVYGLFRKINAITGIITTIAGSDTASSYGHGCDGCLATCAGIFSPYDLCYDHAGDFYIADAWYSEIRKVNIITGIIDSFAAGNRVAGNSGDGGPAISAGLNNPACVCFDTAQRYLYISDCYNHRIRRVDMLTDTITAFAGTGTPGYSGDGGPAINAEFSRVLGIGFDQSNNLYISDWDNARIRKVDAITGIVTTIAGNGTSGYSGDGDLATNAMINKPTYLCFDKCGNLYFSDGTNNRVRRIDGITGIITTIAGNGIASFGGDGDLAVNAELNNPSGVAIDSSCNLYIGDYYNYRIRKVTIFHPFIRISATPGDTICSGSPATIQATLAGGGPAPTFQWVVNGSAMSGTTSSSFTYIPVSGDSVSCILTSSSPCVGNPIAASNTLYLVVDTVTTPSITLSSSASAAVGSVVTVNATVAGAGSTYNINWYDNGVLFTTTTIPSITYTKAEGTDNITATVIPTGAGCYDSTVSSPLTITVSNEAVSTLSQKQGEMYPNPAHTDINIIGQNITNVTISNLLGQTLITQDYNNSSKISINIEALPVGIYTVKITNSEGEKTISKIIKQ